MTLAIVGCGATKQNRPAPARELYTGPLFRAARDHVEARGVRYRILSALYRSVHPWLVLQPYDLTMQAEFARLDALDAAGGDGFRRRHITTIGGEIGNWCSGVGWRQDELPCPIPMRPFRSPEPRTPVRLEVHAGALYAEVIRAALVGWPHVEVVEPLASLSIGRRLSWYRERRPYPAT